MSELQRVPKAEWHVLLADDDDYSLIIERALRAAAGVPVEIRRARTGEEALALLRDSVPDLLLLDLKMPGMGGHRALEEIKKDDALRSVAVAILSSSDRDEDVATSYGLGGNHFITKPENPAELERSLRSLLKNVEELSGIRRGSGSLAATAVSAVNPGSVALRQFLVWGALVAVVVFLIAFAISVGVL